MLKVLIVDDDAYPRNDLKNIMNWGKNGFKLLGEASDGRTAIDMIKKNTPDILITDINMPIMSGIALIDYIRANFPHVKIIALSGYDDFDYVRHSMIKGAKDYLLKDRLNETILLNTLKSVVEDIRVFEETSKEEHIQHQLLTGRQMLKRNFIKRLIARGFNDVNAISHEASSLNLNLELKNNIMIIMEVDNYSFLKEIHSSEELDSFIKTILDISNEILMEWGKAERFYLGDARFLLVFSVDTSLGYYNTYTQLIEIVNKIRKSIKNFLNLTACFSISKICPNIMDFDKYYEEAEKVLEDKFYRGKDNIFTVDSVGEIKNVFITLTIEDEKNINIYLQSRNYEQISGYLSKIFDNIVKLKANHKSVQMICVELISIVNKTAKLYGLKTSDIYLNDNDENPYDKIKKYDNIMDIKEWLIGIYKKLINLMDTYGIDNSYSEYTKKTIEFVNKNYKKDISLGDAADHIGVSSSYLSKIFKEDYGKGFVEFLNMIRIQNAKALLENDMISLKDIADEVGFNNYHYFFRVFKNIVGVTPVKYKKDINRIAGN